MVGDDGYGKELDGDIWEGKRTLMLIHAIRESNAAEHTRLSEVLCRPREGRTLSEVRWIRKLMNKYGCADYARKIAHGLAGAALHEYSLISAGLPDSRDKQFLEQIVTWVIERN